MTNEELTKLILLAMRGDPAAFEQVVATKAEQIVYMSIKMLKNRHDGEDAAQETMMKMYQHFHTLESPKAFNRWTYQITFRTCIDMIRRKSRDDHEFLEQMNELNEMKKEFLPQEYIEDAAKHEFLLKVIDDLPEYYRACLLLCYYEEMSYREIASVLDISEKMVTNTLYRAKQKIRKQMETEYGSIKEMLSLGGMATTPVLTQVFRTEVPELVSPEQLAQLISGVSAGVGAAVTGAAASGSSVAAGTTASATTTSATTTAATSATAASASTSTAASATTAGLTATTKVAVGLIAAATAVGGTAFALQSGVDLDYYDPAIPTAAEEQVILTLADMIGTEAAEQLQGFVTDGVSPADWEAFLVTLPVTNRSGAQVGEAAYSLYHMERQEKQLMLLEKATGNSLEVVYRFTDAGEAEPEHLELLESMERWRQ